MPRDPKHDVLFEPIAVGPKVAKNRFWQTPHCAGPGSEGPGAQAAFQGIEHVDEGLGFWEILVWEGVADVVSTEIDDIQEWAGEGAGGSRFRKTNWIGPFVDQVKPVLGGGPAGLKCAREFASPHPERPLPWIRERQLWGAETVPSLPSG